jgi:hypothetical protein
MVWNPITIAWQNRLFIACASLLLGLCMYSCTMTPAPAHSWYERDCCHDKDCHPIASCAEIKELPDGSYVWNGITFAKASRRVSHDNSCHVCVMEGMPLHYGICIYIPDPFTS